jgi:hypothetical protein
VGRIGSGCRTYTKKDGKNKDKNGGDKKNEKIVLGEVDKVDLFFLHRFDD